MRKATMNENTYRGTRSQREATTATRKSNKRENETKRVSGKERRTVNSLVYFVNIWLKRSRMRHMKRERERPSRKPPA